MFEKASRLALRFTTSKGNITVEDVWNLPLTTTVTAGVSLDNLAKSISRQLKETEAESFVVQSSKADELLQLRFDLIKHIISVRLAEADKAKTLKANKEKKEKIMEIITKKKDEVLANSSVDDLEKMLNAL